MWSPTRVSTFQILVFYPPSSLFTHNHSAQGITSRGLNNRKPLRSLAVAFLLCGWVGRGENNTEFGLEVFEIRSFECRFDR